MCLASDMNRDSGVHRFSGKSVAECLQAAQAGEDFNAGRLSCPPGPSAALHPAETEMNSQHRQASQSAPRRNSNLGPRSNHRGDLGHRHMAAGMARDGQLSDAMETGHVKSRMHSHNASGQQQSGPTSPAASPRIAALQVPAAGSGARGIAGHRNAAETAVGKAMLAEAVLHQVSGQARREQGLADRLLQHAPDVVAKLAQVSCYAHA